MPAVAQGKRVADEIKPLPWSNYVLKPTGAKVGVVGLSPSVRYQKFKNTAPAR